MEINFIINALLVTAIWLLPILTVGTLLDQLIPKIKEDESTAYTLSMVIFQLVLFFILFEFFKKLIIFVNKRFFKGFKMPQIVNGVIILGIIKGASQQTLDKRLQMLYNRIDKNLEKIGIP